ncbi:MBL fold metallo-hydrolase [Streptomyces sp. KR80]|uniref:MBL fold metallo-hydrolase n=1 Tax=Streptomyces sp. KR80 TaxID=3457426 RepID=UPI003FD12A37
MTRPTPPAELVELTDGFHLWAPGIVGTWGFANCALISAGEEALLVDTPYTADLTRSLRAAADRVLPGGVDSIRTVVNTHPNGDHTFGNQFFPGAEIISSATAREHARHEPGPDRMEQLVHSTDPLTPLGWYMREHFPTDYSGLRQVLPTRVFSGKDTLSVGDLTVELLELGPAHTAGDVVVYLPEQRAVCAGDIIFVSDHPVHWVGPLARVQDACHRILDLDPDIIVPGHGPVIGQGELRNYIGYLQTVERRIHASHARGLTAEEATADLMGDIPHPHLGLPERLVILTGVEYRSLDRDTSPLDMVALVDSAARFAGALRDAVPGPRGGTGPTSSSEPTPV